MLVMPALPDSPTIVTPQQLGHIHQANETIARQLGITDARPGGVFQLGLTGTGVELGLWDIAPPLTTHIEFGSRVTYADADPISPDKHATNMAGTAIAAGELPEARGMAPEATLTAYLAGENREIITMGEAATAGLRISWHPYTYAAGWLQLNMSPNDRPDVNWTWAGTLPISETEDFVFGYYAPRTARWDSLAHRHPHFLIIKAAGNQHGQGPSPQPTEHWVFDFISGTWQVSDALRDLHGASEGSSLSYASLAKNALTIGAATLIDPSYNGPESVEILPSSGRGGADDGRIKPELVALSDVTETPSASGAAAYSTAGGTSAAASVTAGTAALLLEHYRRQFQRDPLASTYKALLIHTADPAGPHAGPDYTYGFGLLNAGRALRYLEAAGQHAPQVRHEEGWLPDGGQHSYTLTHDGRGPLRITLAWTDPPGVPLSTSSEEVLNNRTPILVNDLDIRVTDPSGGVWMPWTLDPDYPSSPPQRADNTVDPVEHVLIDAPLHGTYTITVQHKGTLAGGGQSYSLFAGPAELLHRRYTSDQAGWRLVSLPHEAMPWSALNDFVFTQGGPSATWSTYTGNASNLWLFDAAHALYTPAAPGGGTFRPGHGYLLYMYPENPPGFPSRSWLPGSWFTHGPVPEQVDVDLDGVQDWFLAGNPFASALDWEEVYAASEGVRPGIAMWNPEGSDASGTAGDQSGFVYRSAGLDPVGEEALVAPFAGFFVQRDAGEDGILRFRRDQQVRGGQAALYGKRRSVDRRQVGFVGLEVRPDGEGAEWPVAESALVRVMADDRSESGYDWLDIDRMAGLNGGFSVGSLVDDRVLAWDVRPDEDLEQGTVVTLLLCGAPEGVRGFELRVSGSMEASWRVESSDSQGSVVRVDAADLAWGPDGCRVMEVALQTGGTPTSSSRDADLDGPPGDGPFEVRLAAAYPNPFNASTTVRLELPEMMPVRLDVFDLTGRRVQTLTQTTLPAGIHEVRFDAGSLSTGMYILRLQTPTVQRHLQVTLIK